MWDDDKIIELRPLLQSEREDFMKRNQAAFKKAAVETFGAMDREVISKEDILSSLDAETAQAFQILYHKVVVGGVVVQIDSKTQHNSLDLLFIDPKSHGKGIGIAVWNIIEKKYPDTIIWETHTPYFETRNIHFYVNKCGFHIVEFYNEKHPDPHGADTPGGDLFFRFEKKMK
ncbi:GNAT family N-acetyltransferase [Butyricicoccus sp.]|uniref:GNAT family N-acetyltransferase n=1 Tax=Butyricicoccus sp. TaxID=2049021 RepID=UPI003F170CE5